MQKEKEKDGHSAASNKCVAAPLMTPSGMKGHQKTQARSTEEVWGTILKYYACVNLLLLSFLARCPQVCTPGKQYSITINDHISSLGQ